MDTFYLIHETSYGSLEKILQSGYLFISSKTQKLDSVGQGSKNRRLTTDPMVSLTNPNFYDMYDEVDGVYLRLHPRTATIRSQFSECVLIFSTSLLNHLPFVINSEENFGFLIDREGIVSESQFSGEPGFSIRNIDNLKLLKDLVDFSSTEVVILKDVPISYIKYVFYTKPPPAQLQSFVSNFSIQQFNIS